MRLRFKFERLKAQNVGFCPDTGHQSVCGDDGGQRTNEEQSSFDIPKHSSFQRLQPVLKALVASGANLVKRLFQLKRYGSGNIFQNAIFNPAYGQHFKRRGGSKNFIGFKQIFSFDGFLGHLKSNGLGRIQYRLTRNTCQYPTQRRCENDTIFCDL